MNVAGITGYIVNDLELKSTNGGVNVCTFTVAVKRPNVKDQTDFIDCVAWRERAEFLCKFFKKGSRIEVGGHIETRLAVLKDETKRKYTELYCENIGFGEKKGEGEELAPEPEKTDRRESKRAPSYQEQSKGVKFSTVSPEDSQEDLPF